MAKRHKSSGVTIQDVAKTAGVSVSTVSRVLNEKDDVSPTTYEKVRSVISELGYTSSLAARSMRSRQTNVIGLVVPDVEQPFSIEVMKGVNHAIAQLEYDLIVYTNCNIKKYTSTDQQRHYVALLNNSITDGVIVVTPVATSFAMSAPIVAIDPNNENPNCPAIIATNREGSLAVMKYLIGLGHRRIGFIGGRTDLQSALRRQQGYLDGLEYAGIPIDPDLMQVGDFTVESGYFHAQQLLASTGRPTAIFAANDQSAFGAITAAQEMGMKIPDDLSVVGFDDIPEAAHYLPGGLTTVNQSVLQMGLVAVEMLVKLIKGETLDKLTTKIPTQLIIRGSCRAV